MKNTRLRIYLLQILVLMRSLYCPYEVIDEEIIVVTSVASNEDVSSDEITSQKKNSDVVIEDETFICRDCEYQFEGNLDFRKHLDAKGCNDVLKNHISKLHNCLYCESMFSNKSDLNSHTKNQHEKQLKHCGSCEIKVECDTEASEHTEKAHR